MSTRDDLLAASSAFLNHYLAENGLTGAEGGKADEDGRKSSSGMLRIGSEKALQSAGGAESSGGAAPDKKGKSKADSKFASNAWRQYKTLLGRELLSITRNPFDVAGRTLTFAWVGIVMGILYYGMPVSLGY
jgi:hypothetical protein